VQPIPFSAVRAVVESEFGEVPQNIFAQVSKAPVAAASIAQVHRAKIAAGAAVAVKVQRPGIEAVIREDLDILESIARFIDRRTKYGRFYDCTGMVEEFRATVQNELDFTKEAENADVLRKNFRQDEGIAVPAIR
jgi:ubiquinone biosynthesis protein